MAKKRGGLAGLYEVTALASMHYGMFCTVALAFLSAFCSEWYFVRQTDDLSRNSFSACYEVQHFLV